MKLLQGDCLELMRDIPDGSIDMILCDMPYGTTACKWDKRLDLDAVWEQYRRVIRSHGCIALFSQLPFAVDLINANRKWFRYEWIWNKPTRVGFLNANKMPLRAHENILIFYDHLPTYHPQMTRGKPYVTKCCHTTPIHSSYYAVTTISDGRRYPVDVLGGAEIHDENHVHSTQKPVPLLEYLIRTYTDEGEVVLDNCMRPEASQNAVRAEGCPALGFDRGRQWLNRSCMCTHEPRLYRDRAGRHVLHKGARVDTARARGTRPRACPGACAIGSITRKE